MQCEQINNCKLKFQLVFAEDLKEHLELSEFPEQHKLFCTKASKLTEGRVALGGNTSVMQ